MENILLEMLPPSPVEVDVMVEVGETQHNKTVKFRPFTLRDEKEWVERFGSESDPVSKTVEEGDFSVLCSIVIKQMDEEDQKWMCEKLEVDSKDKLVERVLDMRYGFTLGMGLINILGALRGASMPGEDRNRSGSKKKFVSRLMMNWECTLFGGLVGLLIGLAILPLYRQLLSGGS